ncbi:MAG TPA: hypothetical protein VD978_19150 [Azospirillum sp.]|nr:hypothetical protein [Azospirillum sp.]
MALFDFPRIHFFGTQLVNPGTGNNNSLGPGEELTVTSNTEQVMPEQQGMTDEQFRQWIAGADQDGFVRGQWNLYGDMGFRFIDVAVNAVQLGYGAPVTDKAQDPLIGAQLFLNSALVCDNDPEGFDSTQIFAESLELRAPGALAGTGTFFSRKPTRATTISLNWYRNVSFHGVLGNDTSGGAGGASASFQHVVRIEPDDLKPFKDEGAEYDEALHKIAPLLDSLGTPASPAMGALYEALKKGAKGLVIRYNLYLCYPRISDSDLVKDFAQGKRTENPAIGLVLGTISPWYEEDETTAITMGRYLKSTRPYVNPYRADKKPYYIAPMIAAVDRKTKHISVDTINSLPEDGGEGFKYNLGTVVLAVREATPPGRDPSQNTSPLTVIGTFDNTKQAYEAQGGIYDFSYAGFEALVENPGYELVVNTELFGTLLYEPEYMLYSDSVCNYLEQRTPEEEEHGLPFVPPGRKLEPGLTSTVTLHLRRRGERPTGEVPVRVEQWKFTPSGDPKLYGFYRYPVLLGTEVIAVHGDKHTFKLRPTNGPGVRAYRFQPNANWPATLESNLLANLMMEQYYSFVRVLPYEDFSEVTRDQLTFEFVYDKVLRYYDLILPYMSKRLDMADRTIWNTPTAARYLMRTTDPTLWGTYSYMPRTRDLSEPRRKLLWRYCQKVIEELEAPMFEEDRARLTNAGL